MEYQDLELEYPKAYHDCLNVHVTIFKVILKQMEAHGFMENFGCGFYCAYEMCVSAPGMPAAKTRKRENA